MIEALASGASMSIVLVANIAVNLIAFVAILAFVDGILMWLGGMVGKPDLSFEVCSFYQVESCRNQNVLFCMLCTHLL